MSREARRFSKTGMYHIIFRGMNHCHLFEEDKDYEKFLEILKNVKSEKNFEVYAYCLMSNHVHILMVENAFGDISTIMRKLLTKYVGWFNRKYKRSGSLIANRYKSKPVESEDNLISLVRYIHQNPIKAGISNEHEQYKWSSYIEYTKNKGIGISTKEYFLGMISENDDKALEAFIKLHQEEDKREHEISDSNKKTEEEIRQIIVKYMSGREPHELGEMPKIDRNRILKELKEKKQISIRQIERATGIARGVIARA